MGSFGCPFGSILGSLGFGVVDIKGSFGEEPNRCMLAGNRAKHTSPEIESFAPPRGLALSQPGAPAPPAYLLRDVRGLRVLDIKKGCTRAVHKGSEFHCRTR